VLKDWQNSHHLLELKALSHPYQDDQPGKLFHTFLELNQSLFFLHTYLLMLKHIFFNIIIWFFNNFPIHNYFSFFIPSSAFLLAQTPLRERYLFNLTTRISSKEELTTVYFSDNFWFKLRLSLICIKTIFFLFYII